MRIAVLLFLLIALAPAALHAQGDPLAWLNGVRHAAGAPVVAPDELLCRAASLWAARLAAAGILSHRGDDGSTGLDRYRAVGGTEVRVGEILGAGPGLIDVEKGWMASREHRMLALDPGWTHVGWGSAVCGSARVTVMMFAEKRVDELLIEQSPDGLAVSGRFLPSDAGRAALYNGLDQVAPAQWDPSSKRFLFEIPDEAVEGLLRLGYMTVDGRFVPTNSFTLPRGKGSPGGQSRSAAPAPSP